MKKILSLILLSIVISFYSCGNKKTNKQPEQITIETNPEVKKEAPKNVEVSPEQTALIKKGQQLFKDKTCITCHLTDTKVVGPSVKDISRIYKEKDADIVAFLKSESDPIVDTNPGQVTIMKANLDSFVKNLKDDELQAIKAYMMSVK
ncbi:c-type cytochrome [Yeosuana marina]|uniref:c-type cytochrome n=1 Tax=Yeosuana marina TaxID=1565536 RepID=UPI00142248FA|nr:c-type cytochrome [Yeosuana marina]